MDVNMKLKLLSEERDGPILRCLYACPCGQGTVEEEQDYTEGHRDCWASLKCSICRNNYKVIFSDSGLSWDIVKNDSVQIEKTKEIIQNRSVYMPYSYVINSNHTVSLGNTVIISNDDVVAAINFCNHALRTLDEQTKQFDINVFEAMGMRNLSGIVGEYFAKSIQRFSHDSLHSNLHQDGYKKKGKDVCSGHYIREQELGAILLDDIRRVTHFARQNELRFAEHIRKKQGKEAQQEIAVLQKKIDTMQKRQAELTKLFKRLYEDSVLGRIPDEQYRILSQEYTAEQKEIQEQLPAMEVRLQELKDSSSNITRFIENAKRYSEIPELTAEILRIFIKRVEVGERAEKYSRTAPQEVRVYYRDIGLVDELPQSMADSVAEKIPNEVA